VANEKKKKKEKKKAHFITRPLPPEVPEYKKREGICMEKLIKSQ